MEDENYFSALVRMFEQSLKVIVLLETSQRDHFLERLERVFDESSKWGWGVDDDLNDLMAEYGFAER